MVYVFIANGSEETEAIATLDIIRRANFKAQLVGVGSREVTTSHGVTIVTDTEISNIDFDFDFDMIVLPGGMPGTINLEKNPLVQKAIDTAVKKNAFIAAICAAPSILGHKGLLSGRRATCFPGYESELKGAELIDVAAVRDGNIITANGPGAVFSFGKLIVEALGGNAAKTIGALNIDPELY